MNIADKNLKEKYTEEIKEADINFSTLSEKEGTATAFIKYAGDDVVMLRDKKFPLLGKKELEDYYNARPDDGSKLTWYPLKAEAAESGEIGYSFGNWEYKTHDTTFYGNYVSVWKRNVNGEWKYILDGGVSTPKPEEKD
ncbi:MAG: hypothetical protein K8H86_05930 [Ignavibacteriaceae bacterium]|nr:hypothetical protein [Ignavibacteriaceae bacterium]